MSDEDVLVGQDGMPDQLPRALEFEASRYATYVADLDLTDRQQRELLETLWSILRTFVELGFSVEACSRLVPWSKIILGTEIPTIVAACEERV